MPTNKLPGKLLSRFKKYKDVVKKLVSFEKIFYLNNLFIKPSYQGSLDQDKVNEMYASYIKNPHFLRAKDNITIGVIDNTYYIIDGQHRFELAKKLYSEQKIEDHLIFSYFTFHNKSDAISLYEELNKDSVKNMLYINSDIFEKIKINNLKQIFKSNFSLYFAKRKSKHGRRYTIEEFTDKLIEINYINTFESAKDIFVDIKQKNDIFYKKCLYASDLKYNKNIYCKNDIYNIEHKHIYPLKKK